MCIRDSFNIAIFDNELTDMQLQYGYISATAGPTTTVANAGEARIKGFEIEAFFQLYEGLTLNLSYSDLDTELIEASNIDPQRVNEAVTAASGDPVAGQLASQTATPIADKGDELPFAAENAWVATLGYQLPIPSDWGVLSASLLCPHRRTARRSLKRVALCDTAGIQSGELQHQLVGYYG